MPLNYAHAARLVSPDQFDHFAVEKNKGGDGVDFLYGIKNGKSRLASVRFDKKKFTPTRARQWLKKHGLSPIEFASAQEGVQAENMDTITEVIKQPSYEQLRSLVSKALDNKYPPQMNEYGYTSQIYDIRTLWADRVLVAVGYGIPESATSLGKSKYGLATFTVDMAENEVELDDLIPASIQAVPTSGEPVVLDEANHGAEENGKDGNGWIEAGRRNSRGDAGALNHMVRLALSLMGEGDLEEETHGVMRKRMKAMKKNNPGSTYEADEGDEMDLSEASYTDSPWNGDKSRFSIEELMRSVPRAMARWAKSQASKENRDVIKSDLHLPYKEPDGTINLAGVRNAKARAPLVQGVPSDIKNAAVAELDRALSAGNASTGKKESVEPSDDAILEGWQGMPGETLRESFTAPLAEAKIEKTSKEIILRNVFILGPHSANGRSYSEAVQQKALPLFEGMKAYLNHPAKSDLSEPRKVQDLIGEYKNVRVQNGRTIGDMHLLNNEIVRGTVLPIAESKPHLVGNSIVARGSTSRNKEGVDVVTEIHAVRSADLVAEPATTDQLFAEGRTEEAEMELKSLTIEELKKERPDLFKEMIESQQSADRQKSLEEENKRLRDAVAENDAKIAQFELRDAKRQKQDQVAKLMREAKIPDKVKYTAEGKIKSHFLNLLERCEKEEDVKALLTDWEETYQQGTGVISESKTLSLGNGEISPVAYERAVQAFMG